MPNLFQLNLLGVEEVERGCDPEVIAGDCEELWMDERARQHLLESVGQLTIADLFDGVC